MIKKGKAKSILESSIDSALLAVEIYNKPRATFRTEAFITLMIIAWTRLFHCYFFRTIGDKYYFKDPKSKRFKRKDEERMAWDLSECIHQFGCLSVSAIANLKLFIPLRNKIEHRHIDKREFDTMLFGECQALLFNFENQLIDLFGEEYALNETLAFSLQFSTLRKSSQKAANKRALSADLDDIKKFVEHYRSTLSNDVFNSDSYSIKLIQIPKISNTNRNDIAIEFVNWSSLSEEDKNSYDQVTTLIKDKIIKQPVINHGGMKPTKILEMVNQRCGIKLSHYDHKCLYVIFSIRPESIEEDPFNTDPNYCHYDDVHGDYVYQNDWAEKIVEIISAGKLNKHQWTQAYKKRKKINLDDYL